MSVTRSHRNITVQVIDDEHGRTLCHASTMTKGADPPRAYGGNAQSAKQVGLLVAQRAQAAGIVQVVLDRNGYKFHGRIKALADAAREGGLQF